MKLLSSIGFILALTLSIPTKENQISLINNAYYQGYIDFPLPLSKFAPHYLYPACAALKNGNLSVAKKAFAEEMRRHPTDYVATIGFLQSVRIHLRQLLPQYEKDVRLNPSVFNQFKLGVLAVYVFKKYYQNVVLTPGIKEQGVSPKDKLEAIHLQHLLRSNLSSAWERSYSPVIGFFLASLFGYVNPGSVLNSMLLHCFHDPSIYHAYVYAVKHDWKGPQPPIKKVSLPGLIVLGWIVADLYSWSSVSRSANYYIKGGRTIISKKPITIPPPPSQKRAMAYLKLWLNRINKQIDEMESKTHRR